MVQVEFTKEFATKKKGDIMECESQLASKLVKKRKVAKYTMKGIEAPKPKLSKPKSK